MEMGIALTLDDVKVEREGTVLLPGRLLADVARSLPQGDVTLEQRTEERDVELTAGDARFHFRTLPADDFPRLPEVEGDVATLPAGPLAETIDRVARAASRDEVRPILTGVLVQAEGDSLTMVATDSYRLSVKHTKLETALAQPIDANVPARALRELARLIANGSSDSVEISLSRNQVVFSLDNVALSSRLIEGQFPSWRQLIPETFDHEVRLPREELLEVARRVSQLAQRNAPLRFAFAEGELTVAAETPDIGDVTEGMPAPYSGEPLEIAFNPQFLLEGLTALGTHHARLAFTQPSRPAVLSGQAEIDGESDESYRYVLMPVRFAG